jgi:GNAT superfamily N-acetyltransferase
MKRPDIEILESDPRGPDALALLHEAAVEARALYPEIHGPGAPWPTNPPTPKGGVYLVAYADGKPVACGALRPLGEATGEIRRMYVTRSARRRGCAAAILQALEANGLRLGYTRLRLETGRKQTAAMALYEAAGFRRIEPFGEYADDPNSVCFEKVTLA